MWESQYFDSGGGIKSNTTSVECLLVTLYVALLKRIPRGKCSFCTYCDKDGTLEF